MYDEVGIAGNSVPFTLSLTESRLNRVSGYVRDDASRGGQPERGRILGRRHGHRIHFIKTMPKAYATDADGERIEVQELLEREGETELSEEMTGPHRIAYAGELASSGEAIRGEWRILPSDPLDAAEQLDVGSGTWSARRSSYQASEV